MSGPTILVVDPDAKALKAMREALENEGFEVVTARSGGEALARLAEPPALVVSEADLPNIDGFELCQMLRSDPDMERVPFFMLASQVDNARRMLAREVGACDYFAKPFFVSDIRALTRLFAGRKAGEAAYGGDLALVPLLNLLRTMVAGARSGQIDLLRENGQILFKQGRIIDAQVADLEGTAALERLLLLSEGPFTLHFMPVVGPGKLDLTIDDLVSREQPRRRRFERLVAAVGGLDAKLVLDYPTLARELKSLPDSLNALIRLFDGRRSVGDVLRDSFLDELTTLDVLTRLHRIGVLVPNEPVAAAPAVLPPLFEPKKDEVEAAVEVLFPVDSAAASADLPADAAQELRDWFADFTANDPAELPDGGWTEVKIDAAGEELRAFEAAVPATELVKSAPALEQAIEKELSTPAGASQMPVPSWAFAAADEAVAAVLREHAEAEEVTREALVADATEVSDADIEAAFSAEVTTPSVVVGGELAGAARDIDPDEEAFFRQVKGGNRRSRLMLGAAGVAAAALVIWMFAGSRSEAPVAPPEPATVVASTTESLASSVEPSAVEPMPLDPAQAELAAAMAAIPDVDAVEAPAAAPVVEAPAAASGDEVLAAARKLYDAGKLDAALAKLDEAVKVAPGRAEVFVLKALAHFDNDQTGAAEKAAIEALKLDEKAARAVLVLGMVHQARGQDAKAKAEYERYLTLEPKGAHAGDVKAILAGL